MGCCQSRLPSRLQETARQQKNENVIDLNALIEAYAMDQFLQTATYSQLSIPESNLSFDVDWSKIKIVHTQENGKRNGAEDQGDSSHDDGPTLLVEQEYQNKFEVPIQHTFEAERVSKCTGMISIEKGVSFSKGVEIKLPEYRNNPASRMFPRTVILGASQQGCLSETLEENLTWSMKTTIPIAAHTTVLARLNVLEEVKDGTFKVTTKMHGGPLKIFVKNSATNQTLMDMQGWLTEILRDLGLSNVICSDDHVTFVNEGSTFFRFGIRTIEDAQEITDHQHKRLYPRLPQN